ncbi:TPA: DNA methyltransferase [Enterobacter kobei]|uniref:DNA methyltransferase n=1 Tax=Enterobacter kobei TaxID=208224 RepID=UPI003B89826E
MSKFNELVTKLREVFQIDRPELDFGVYRILNARADEINEYLEKRLKGKVEQALASGNAANINQLKEELKKAEQGAQALGVPADSVPKVQEIKAKITQASGGNAEHENAVFSHLLTFFSRYYDNGDFISQRRYKGDTYAIPYAGEEVMLHWANKDQYYIKSGENFSNYSFKLEDGRVVHFRLVAADTAKDNRKDNDKERRFVLAEQKIITRIDDEGDEYDDEILPIEEITNKDTNGNETKELIIRFEYKAMPKGSKQDSLVSSAVKAVLAASSVASRWLNLSKREPTEKNPKRTLLEKHLTNYTTKNTADYFIHKNLGKFLRGELDFYIKNEVMHLDDVQNAETFSDIEKNLRMIQCLRSIALDLIKFLAQLEDFQKKLWTKKKFIAQKDYLISVDYLESDQLETVCQNERQIAQWKRLGVISGGNIKADVLAKSKGLTIDTSLFDDDFKNLLLNQIDNLSQKINGTLISGDNFQALRFLEGKYKNSIDAIYIDPPYNTDASAILYKNDFKDSSWLSFMESRLEVANRLMKPNTLISVAIDDEEVSLLRLLMSSLFPKEAGVGVVKVNPQSRKTKGKFSPVHEYALFYGNSSDSQPASIGYDDAKLDRYPLEDDLGRYAWMNFIRAGSNDKRSDRPKLYYPIVVTEKDQIRVPKMSWNDLSQCYDVLEDIAAGEVLVYPDKFEDGVKIEKNWQRGNVRVATEYDEYRVRRNIDGEISIDFKTRMDANALPTTWWDKKEYASANFGAAHLKDLFGEKNFDFPKAKGLVKNAILACTGKDQNEKVVLDFFAGSGTTAQAVSEIRREINPEAKFIIVDQGEYFDTLIKPRVQKVNFCSSWKNGKPVNASEGLSSIFEVIKLESYEDALNNLELKKPKVDLFDNNPELKDDYLLNYMLDVESRGSLLSTDDFKKPFDYTMKIAVDSAGAFEEQKVDLVETFNYLIGLTVKHIDAQPDRGFVTVTGTLPSGETCLVLWRDCEKIDYEGLSKLCDKLEINPADNEFDVVYINGDHNIPTVLTRTAEEGGETRVLKLRQIEPEFLERMFAEEDI